MPFALPAQETASEWVSADAVIKSIEKKGGKQVREIATVAFATADGDSIETYVELPRIPFLGSFKSAGDEIKVNYQRENPALVETDSGKFLSQYGMYILIALGTIFSISSILKARKKGEKA